MINFQKKTVKNLLILKNILPLPHNFKLKIMKKLFLVGALALFSAVNAQSGFNIGAHVGLPLGSNAVALGGALAGAGTITTKTTSSFALGLDVAYRFQVMDKLFVGPATGYQAFLGKEIEDSGSKYKYKTTSVVPITASAVYKFTEQFGAGLDLGYGIAFGGELSTIDGKSVEDYFGGQSSYLYSGFATAVKDATKAKSSFLWAPKVYYSFGKSSLWLGYQGLNLVGSTGSFNLGFSYSLK